VLQPFYTKTSLSKVLPSVFRNEITTSLGEQDNLHININRLYYINHLIELYCTRINGYFIRYQNEHTHTHTHTYTHTNTPKWHIFVRLIISLNVDQFSNCLDHQNRETFRNNIITKDPISPRVCRYTTF